MAREFVGNSANIYLLPATQGDGEQAKQVYQTMAELILLTIEPDYRLDDKFRIVKSQVLDTIRLHISVDNLGRYIDALTGLRDQMQAFALQDEQQRAGVDPAQMALPGI